MDVKIQILRTFPLLLAFSCDPTRTPQCTEVQKKHTTDLFGLSLESKYSDTFSSPLSRRQSKLLPAKASSTAAMVDEMVFRENLVCCICALMTAHSEFCSHIRMWVPESVLQRNINRSCILRSRITSSVSKLSYNWSSGKCLGFRVVVAAIKDIFSRILGMKETFSDDLRLTADLKKSVDVRSVNMWTYMTAFSGMWSGESLNSRRCTDHCCVLWTMWRTKCFLSWCDYSMYSMFLCLIKRESSSNVAWMSARWIIHALKTYLSYFEADYLSKERLMAPSSFISVFWAVMRFWVCLLWLHESAHKLSA